MDKRDLQDLVMKLRKESEHGKNRFDPALANLLFKTQSQIDEDIETVIEEFLNKKGRQPTEEEIAATYVILEEKREKIKDLEVNPYFTAQKVDLEYQEEQKRLEEERRLREENDIAYNLDLNRKLAQLVKGLKQKSEQELNREYLTIGAKFFEEIPGDKLPQVLEFLKNEFGFEFKGNEHESIEKEGRDISEEITKEAIGKGEVKISISKDKLQSKDFIEHLEEIEKRLSDTAKEVEQVQLDRVTKDENAKDGKNAYDDGPDL